MREFGQSWEALYFFPPLLSNGRDVHFLEELIQCGFAFLASGGEQ